MKTITVDVTAEDIAQGVKGDIYSCMVARALSRAVGRKPGKVHVGVWSWGIENKQGGLLPPIASENISAILHNGKVQPFSFTLNVNDDVFGPDR